MDDQAGAGEAPEGGRSERKRRAILEAATEVFLRSGYLGASMDEIAAASSVSKQTIYKQFGSKEALFEAAVAGMTSSASDVVHRKIPDPETADQMAEYLANYGFRQLTVVLTPRLMQLRRMVIGEANRFPQLGRALYESGPRRAMGSFAEVLDRLSRRGLLRIENVDAAAAQFNWLVMGGPLNEAMLLGDEAVPAPAVLRRHAAEAARVFLAAYQPYWP